MVSLTYGVKKSPTSGKGYKVADCSLPFQRGMLVMTDALEGNDKTVFF